MLKKLLVLLFVVCCICSTSFAIGDSNQMPDVDVLYSRTVYLSEDCIVGMARIRNNTNAYFSDLHYTLGLMTSAYNSSIYSYEIGKTEPVKFSIGAKEEKDVYFKYDFPEYIPEDVNTLCMKFSTRTMPLATGEQYISLDKKIADSSDGFLLPAIDKNQLVWEIGKTVAGAETGPNITPKDKPVAKIELKSTFNQNVNAIPKVKIYKRSIEYNKVPVLEKAYEPIKLSSNQEKTIKLEIPVISEPDSYFVTIEFYNEEGKVISNEFDFRYVVKGQNGKILNTYLTEGNNGVVLNIFASGPADAKSTIEDGLLTCKIVSDDYQSTVFYEEKFPANLGVLLGRKNIQLEKYGVPVVISLSLRKDDIVYDEYSFSADLNNLTSRDLGFTDVSEKNQKEAVSILNAIGMINGYPDGTFKPNNNITRAEFTVIATRLAGLEVKPGQVSTFSDVPSHHWAKDYINVAHANGCISGYGNGIFKPDNNVTVAESITILMNVLGYKNTVAKSNLGWPSNYMFEAQELGINKGVTYNSYMEPATRGKVSVMTLNSWLHKLSKGGN